MILTEEQLNGQIRPLQWKLKEYNGKLYRTTLSMNDTQLFWIDFIRNIFVPLFSSQKAITRLPAFDTTTPVLLEDVTNNLYLSTQLESVVYYAKNKDSPACIFMPFGNAVSALIALLISIVIIVLLVCLAFLSRSSSSSSSTTLII